jgi:hypothetical protein
LERTTDWYAHGDPLKMPEAIQALTKLWDAVERRLPHGVLTIC